MSQSTRRVVSAALLPVTLATFIAGTSRTIAQTPAPAAQEAPAVQSPTPSSPGCLSGYPNGRYQGDRPLTRNEFAAGMNACLEQVNTLIPNRADLATREEFEALIQRQRELNAEVRELNDRVGSPPVQKPD